MNNEKNPLREEFETETGITWINSQGEPDIDYVDWLERKVQSQSLPAVEQSEKSLKECKAYIAGRYGYPHFQSLLVRSSHDVKDKAIDDFAKLYAAQFKQPSQPGKTLEEEAPVRNWISVKSDPPKEAGRYLCVVEEQGDLGLSRFVWNCSYSERHGFMDNFQQMNATYWMPLPDLPTPPQK